MITDRTRRIAKNTVMLYVQMFIGMIIGLYTSRVVLNELGVEDYGLYNVIGGVVAMFGLLNMSMSGTTSRFITVALGQGDSSRLKEVFGLSLTIHLLLGGLIVLIAEPIGLWFIQNKMQIPEERMDAAVWGFHCSVATAFIYILNVPFNAMIVAHERIAIFAYFSLIDLFLRLGVVLTLPYFVADKLKLYAVLLLGIQALMQLIYWQYCFRNFQTSRVRPIWNKLKFREMSSFAGWSLFGDSSALLFSQGINILLNLFFGPTVNAARGIAVQVQGVIGRFIGSFQTALNPQLTKSYASKDYAYMHKLIYASSKFSFFLFLLLALPIFFEAHQLLTWWLSVVPEYTVIFLRIILLISLVDCLANPLVVSAKATGKIRKYQSILGTFLLLIVPVSYIFLKLGFPPYTVFVVHFILASIGHYIRFLLVKPLIKLDGKEYLYQVIWKIALVSVIVPILPSIFYLGLDEDVVRFIVVGVSTVFSIALTIWKFGVNQSERVLILEQVKKYFSKIE